MTSLQRIKTFFIGAFRIVIGALLMYFPKEAFPFVTSILGLALMVWGIKHLYYYFTMARFMVDGRIILILGVILLDLGVLSASLVDVPKIYIILYLIIIHAFSGIIQILRTAESMRYGAKSWRLNLAHGVFEIAIVIACFIFIKNPGTVAFIFGIGLINSGIISIITSFRKSALVYIQ